MPASRSYRSLLNAWSALGLIAATGAAFAALFPASRDRESQAFTSPPDMLALSYLNLALSRAPNDAALRVRVAERTLMAGQFDGARRVLAPLLGDHPAPGAAVLRVDIDERAWASVDPKDDARRSIALSRLTDSIERASRGELSADDAEHLAAVCARAGLHATRAVLLERVARADLQNDERLRAADEAWLALGHPLASADLHVERALAFPESDGAVHARLALTRALAAGQPGSAVVAYRKLRGRYGDDVGVLELGLAVLAGVDDVEALGVATELLALRPGDEALRQRVAQLSAWTLREPANPVTPAVVARVAVAAAAPLRWDDGAARDVALPAPETSAQAIERAALLESLGAPERALELLDTALKQGLVDERALWDLQAGVQLRLGQKREALATLAQMDERFGATRASLQRRADLSLSLGDLSGALAVLAAMPGPRDPEDARRVTAIGWELGDMVRVRDAYRAIVRSPQATADDVRRLWLLEHDAGDRAASARTALAGFERLGDLELLQLALRDALDSADEALIENVLAAGKAAGPRLLENAESLRLHVSVRQGRAYRALHDQQPERARAELAESATLLGQAPPELGSGLGALWKSQDRQTLELALAARDERLLARVYPTQAESLSTRERVFVLHRLGRDEEAVGEALSGIESGGLPERDSGALEADADALGADMPRELGVLGDVIDMPGLTAARAGVEGRLSWSQGRSLSARVELTRLGYGEGPGLLLTGQDELAAELGASIDQSRLALGVVALDGRDPRPSLRFEQRLSEAPGFGVALGARLNERSSDSPELRVGGVEDELSARATLEFLEAYSATLRASAKLYSERADRETLGGGATFDAAVGRHWVLPSGFAAHLRAAGYIAPRFAIDAAGPVPDGGSWAGFGAGLTRGQLSLAPVAGRRLSLLADATAGWLVPLGELGWSGRLGLGSSILGADQLSILASASNVASNAPGFAVYTLGADYKVSGW